MSHHDHSGEADEAALAELLDLDAEVLRGYWSDALSWVQQSAADLDVRRILDLGAGTGTGTIELAQRFAEAEVVAVDVSAEMLRRIEGKAQQLGLAERIRTIPADLDSDWPAVGELDLTWASMSLHHLVDPDRVLRNLLTMTRHGGLLAVAEFSDQPRFLPDDLGLGRPGLEERCLALQQAEHAHALPALGADWTARLTAAGFTAVRERTFELAADPSQPAATVAYARGWLGRLRSRFTDRLPAEDRESLAVLLDGDGPHSLGRRDDLAVRGTRTVVLAQRP